MHLASTSLHKRPIPARTHIRQTGSWSLSADEEPAGRSNAARGVLIGIVLGAGSWVAIFAAIWWLRP